MNRRGELILITFTTLHWQHDYAHKKVFECFFEISFQERRFGCLHREAWFFGRCDRLRHLNYLFFKILPRKIKKNKRKRLKIGENRLKMGRNKLKKRRWPKIRHCRILGHHAFPRPATQIFALFSIFRPIFFSFLHFFAFSDFKGNAAARQTRFPIDSCTFYALRQRKRETKTFGLEKWHRGNE